METFTHHKRIIAGPCAFESRQQLRQCIRLLKGLGVEIIRASLWKPRTFPGWEGSGNSGLMALLEETLSEGMVPATEVISAGHAKLVAEAIQAFGDGARILVWIGARNQNHLEQKKIAKVLAEGPQTITLMFKNQMWDDEKHWEGIFKHIIGMGFPKERLMSCHRGFSPGKQQNDEGLRNLPDFEMAMRIRAMAGIPMLLDPSHIAGSQQNVFKVVLMAAPYDFDGYVIEVHPQPDTARTDAAQQLTPEQFEELLKLINDIEERKFHENSGIPRRAWKL